MMMIGYLNNIETVTLNDKLAYTFSTIFRLVSRRHIKKQNEMTI